MRIRIIIVTVTGIAPYSQSRAHITPKLERETAEAYEERTWREKCHSNGDGTIFIPPMAFKLSLDQAAQQLGMQIRGKGKATYTKFFASGIMCVDPIVLPDRKDTVPGELVHCHANGKRGSGTRVWRTFPRIDRWSGKVQFQVLADEITEDVFRLHLDQAGAFVGVGRFRPGQGGYFGRYKVDDIKVN